MDFGDSRSAIISAFDVIYTASVWPLALNVFAFFAYFRAARGTRIRYITGALIPPFIYLGLFVWTTHLIADVLRDDSVVSIVMDGLGVGCWVFNHISWSRLKGDDDDFWKSLGGRIKKRLTARRRGLVTA